MDKRGTFIVDSPLKDGDFPKFFVCLPEGNHHGAWFMSHHQELSWLRKKIRAVETVRTKRHKNAGNKAAVGVEIPWR